MWRSGLHTSGQLSPHLCQAVKANDLIFDESVSVFLLKEHSLSIPWSTATSNYQNKFWSAGIPHSMGVISSVSFCYVRKRLWVQVTPGRFQLAQKENSLQEWSATELIFLGKCWSHQPWRLLRFSWTGCWAIFSRLCLSQERLHPMILEGSNDPFQSGISCSWNWNT